MKNLHIYKSTADVLRTAERLQAMWVVIYHDPRDERRRTDYSVHHYAEAARNAAASVDVPTRVYAVADGRLKSVGIGRDGHRSRWAPSMPSAANDDREVTR